MTKPEIEGKLIDIIKEISGITAQPGDRLIGSVDSLDALSIISRAEDEFNVSISPSDVDCSVSVEELAELILKEL